MAEKLKTLDNALHEKPEVQFSPTQYVIAQENGETKRVPATSFLSVNELSQSVSPEPGMEKVAPSSAAVAKELATVGLKTHLSVRLSSLDNVPLFQGNIDVETGALYHDNPKRVATDYICLPFNYELNYEYKTTSRVYYTIKGEKCEPKDATFVRITIGKTDESPILPTDEVFQSFTIGIKNDVEQNASMVGEVTREVAGIVDDVTKLNSTIDGKYTETLAQPYQKITVAISPTDGSQLEKHYSNWDRWWFRIDKNSDYLINSYGYTDKGYDVGIMGFFKSADRLTYISGLEVQKGEGRAFKFSKKLKSTEIPINAGFIAVCAGGESKAIEVYKIEKTQEGLVERVDKLEQKPIDRDTIQLQRVYDDSTIKCSPYMFRLISWHRYDPRINFLMFPDYNDEWDLLTQTCGWFKHDSLIDRSVHAVISAGDTVTAYMNKTKQEWIEKAGEVVKSVNTFDKPYLFCVGNHDTGEDEFTKQRYDAGLTVSRKERYDSWFNPLIEILKKRPGVQAVNTDANNPNSMYYYADLLLNNKKVRLFALDESEYPIVFTSEGHLKYSMCSTGYGSGGAVIGGFNSYYSEKQLKFLVGALASCENDTLFIIMNHIDYTFRPDSGKGGLAKCREALRAIIKGFRENSKGSATVETLEGIPSYTINFDFSSKSGNHPLVHFHGHDHQLKITKDTDMGNVWSIMNVCGGTPSGQLKAVNSIMKYGVDITSINETDWKAYMLKFGYAPFLNTQGNGFSKVDDPMDFKQ